MAKACIVEREIKRRETVSKFAATRVSLFQLIRASATGADERKEARLRLQKLPRNSSPVRLRNRCALTGRPRGVFRKFGIARGELRDLMMQGRVPGVVKASW